MMTRQLGRLHSLGLRHARPLQVLGVIAAMLSLQGCVFVRMKEVKDLEARIAKAQIEMQRLEYVRKRVVEVHDEAAAVRKAIEEAAARKGVAAEIPPTKLNLAPDAVDDLRSTPASMTRVASARPTVRELQDSLDALNQDIQRGINLEKKLPQFEADAQALRHRLAEIEALPATAAGSTRRSP